MIKHPGGEISRGVANAAVLGGRHVVDRLAACADDARTIVAGRAGLHREVDAGVVEHFREREAPGVMAPAAIVDGDGMSSWFAC